LSLLVVPHQDDGLVAPDGVGRVGPPAQAGRIDDVVVQQGGGVQIFEDGGEIVEVFAIHAAHAGAQEKKQGPHPLAAAQQDVLPHLRDERHVGLKVGRQGPVDGCHFAGQLLKDALGSCCRSLLHKLIK
jgi:hypothetical protein